MRRDFSCERLVALFFGRRFRECRADDILDLSDREFRELLFLERVASAILEVD